MDAARFRALALEQAQAVEASHMGHPDFRVGGKIFASLGPGGSWGMAQLAPEEQHELLGFAPEPYELASGAWGRSGATLVELTPARVASVRRALRAPWRNAAPWNRIDELGET